LRSRRRRLSNHRAAKCDLLTLHAPFGPTDDVRDHLLRIACDRPRRWHASDGNPRTQNHDESAISEKGQKAKYSLRANDVRSGPDNGHTATAAACPVRAKSGLMHRSKSSIFIRHRSRQVWRSRSAPTVSSSTVEGEGTRTVAHGKLRRQQHRR
jgi:hypothetical protein